MFCEIDPRGQFHQHAYAQLLHQKRKKDSQVKSNFILFGRACKKAGQKMFMKLSLGVNFINVL